VPTLTNPGKADVAWHLKLNDLGQGGERGATQLSGNVAAGQTSRCYVSLESRAVRRASGRRAWPPVVGDFGQHLGGGVEPNHLTAFQIFRATPKEPATLILRSIYVRSVLREPGFVDCRWFQFYGQPTSGRSQDGENFNIGFASVTDTPYSELIAAARAANAQIYAWHAAAPTR